MMDKMNFCIPHLVIGMILVNAISGTYQHQLAKARCEHLLTCTQKIANNNIITNISSMLIPGVFKPYNN